MLKMLGDQLVDALAPDYVFALFVCRPRMSQTRMLYISSAERPDMLLALHEWLAKHAS